MKKTSLILCLALAVMSAAIVFAGCSNTEAENDTEDRTVLEKIRSSYVDAGYNSELSEDEQSAYSSKELIYRALTYKIEYAAKSDTNTVIYIIEVPAEMHHGQISAGYPEHKTNGLFMVAFVSGTPDYLPFDSVMNAL